MNNSLKLLANLSALVGILICVIAGGFRVTGNYYVIGFEAMTLFFVGVGAMVFATLAKVEMLLQK